MKKNIAIIILALVLCLTLTSCLSNNGDDTVVDGETSETEKEGIIDKIEDVVDKVVDDILGKDENNQGSTGATDNGSTENGGSTGNGGSTEEEEPPVEEKPNTPDHESGWTKPY